MFSDIYPLVKMSDSEESRPPLNRCEEEISESESYTRQSSEGDNGRSRRQQKKRDYFNLVNYDVDSDKENSGPPPKKSHNYSAFPCLEALENKVSVLTTLLSQGQAAASPGTSMRNNQTFLEKPETRPCTKTIDLGHHNTDVDEKRRLRPAKKERLETLSKLQRFDSAEWKEVRYAKALRNFLASPGFTELKVNEELCHLDRKKRYIFSHRPSYGRPL